MIKACCVQWYWLDALMAAFQAVKILTSLLSKITMKTLLFEMVTI